MGAERRAPRRLLDPASLLESAGPGGPDIARLEALAGRSVTHSDTLGRDEVLELCRAAALLESINVRDLRPLDGLIAITAFFEASTRTRLSFESAVLRLDGKVLSVPDGRVTGVAKGETLADVGEMFNSYGDVVIMRHPEEESVEEMAEGLVVPLVNAGNGKGHHPTQALVDWYALLKWRPELAGEDCPEDRRIRLGVVGTPASMRAVKSFLWLATRFAPAIEGITIVSELADPIGEELREPIDESGLAVEITNEPDAATRTADVLYMNSIVPLGDGFRVQDAEHTLSAESGLRSDAVVMHPLARNDELDPSLDDTGHNMYFAQAAGAVFARQALLIALLGRADTLAGAMP